ncbi:PREDICTED: CMP-sialic acid transporter 2-like [Camelina sativa]|uniref:CMP-sialic acid transporter 2-like n=1 Tax=Camelina sativa TaxID=90675 RepID=A0ABM0YY07_CAMSA|nr:PREDICTED: CMP-sialic acid transporter 2-like [Camelina sativa]
MAECSVCRSRLASPSSRAISRAYDKHKIRVSSKQKALNVLLVVGDCMLVGLQPVLVYMCKVDGKFNFSPISVNFLTEIAKVIFAIVMLLFQAPKSWREASTISFYVCPGTSSWQLSYLEAARNNVLLAVPAGLYAINNYLKFTMQLYFNPATVKMLSNLKVLWEALALLLIGISVNQLRSLPEGATTVAVPIATGAYICTFIFVTIPSLASVYNEYALKSQYDTSIYLQVLAQSRIR